MTGKVDIAKAISGCLQTQEVNVASFDSWPYILEIKRAGLLNESVDSAVSEYNVQGHIDRSSGLDLSCMPGV